MCLVHEHVDVAVLTLMTLTMCTVPVMSTCVDARLGVVVNLTMESFSLKHKTRYKLAFLSMLTFCKCLAPVKVFSCCHSSPRHCSHRAHVACSESDELELTVDNLALVKGMEKCFDSFIC